MKLRECVEIKLGYGLATPKDFENCRATIFSSLHENISVSTLKRMWGYVGLSDSYHPSVHSLNTLSQYVGYDTFMAFCSVYRQNENLSNADVKLLVESITSSIHKVSGELEHLRRILDE